MLNARSDRYLHLSVYCCQRSGFEASRRFLRPGRAQVDARMDSGCSRRNQKTVQPACLHLPRVRVRFLATQGGPRRGGSQVGTRPWPTCPRGRLWDRQKLRPDGRSGGAIRPHLRRGSLRRDAPDRAATLRSTRMDKCHTSAAGRKRACPSWAGRCRSLQLLLRGHSRVPQGPAQRLVTAPARWPSGHSWPEDTSGNVGPMAATHRSYGEQSHCARRSRPMRVGGSPRTHRSDRSRRTEVRVLHLPRDQG